MIQCCPSHVQSRDPSGDLGADLMSKTAEPLNGTCSCPFLLWHTTYVFDHHFIREHLLIACNGAGSATKGCTKVKFTA